MLRRSLSTFTSVVSLTAVVLVAWLAFGASIIMGQHLINIYWPFGLTNNELVNSIINTHAVKYTAQLAGGEVDYYFRFFPHGKSQGGYDGLVSFCGTEELFKITREKDGHFTVLMHDDRGYDDMKLLLPYDAFFKADIVPLDKVPRAPII